MPRAQALTVAHGQKVRSAPRKLAGAIPGLKFAGKRGADTCCGSGIYNVVEKEMSMQILAHKMENVNASGAGIIATANLGCLLQLQAGVRLHGKGQRVMHVVELLDSAYKQRGAGCTEQATRLLKNDRTDPLNGGKVRLTRVAPALAQVAPVQMSFTGICAARNPAQNRRKVRQCVQNYRQFITPISKSKG